MNNKKKIGNNSIYFKNFFKLRWKGYDMINYDLLNLVSTNKDIRDKKLDFKNKFKKINDVFLKDVELIERVKSLGCKISGSSNWIVDNFFIIENEAVKLLNNHQIGEKNFISVKFDGKFLPRIYLFCSCVVQNESGIFDGEEFFEKLSEYENNVKLNLKEIRSIPFFLKYSILENIYKIVNEISKIEKQKHEVHVFLHNIMKLIDDGNINNALRKLEKFLEDDISSYSIEYFIELIDEKRIQNKVLSEFLDKILEEKSIRYDDLRVTNNNELDNKRIKISMWIQSLKNISLFNWKVGLENSSSIHKEFLKDPSGVYPNMDYESRKYYRDTLEKICKKNKLNEYMECLNILNLCSKGENSCSKHVGYYLIDDGSKKIRGIRFLNKFKKLFYFSSIVIGIIFSELYLLKYLKNIFDNKFVILGIGLIFLILVSDIWSNIINYLFFKNIKSKFVPKMDYSKKIPNDAKTVVAISAILTNKKDIDDLFRNLELSYICNKGDNIYFSLLFDYIDTLSYEGSEDKNLLEYAKVNLKNLNDKYKHINDTKFYMFVRNKLYNDSNKVYMGWERKRGKIMEFIKFLKGRESTFNELIDDYPSLKDIKYMIIIDSDTRLMRDSAFKLIGAINHVLNKGVVKNIRKKNKVVRGYGIVQPKVRVNFKSSLNTFYSKLFVGNVTKSCYNPLTSKVYQDIFSDSIFIGKGIIDIDIFDKIMWNVIPENKVLNHNLIEGCFSKVLFSPDIEIEEKFLSNILCSFSSLHRQIRGYWQLIPYLFRGRGINFISKYKILDNLKGSLVPISCILLLFINIKYSGLILLSLFLPIILNISSFNISSVYKENISYNFKNLKDKLVCTYVMFSVLPYHAYVVLDAIFKSLLRMIFTKKNLLEWKSFQDIDKELEGTIYLHFIRMIFCSIFGILCTIFCFYFKYYSMILPSVIFISGPIIVGYLSKKYELRKFKISYDQNIFLRSLSRSTFSYFEDFVNESTNYLICDSYQEDKFIGISKKTSPTNIGMSLNSFILARDFGFITVIDMIDKLSKIMDSVDSLPVYRGHLYSCYDIKNVIPLGERYISTVDSGNLLASYYFCKKSLEDILNRPIIHTDLVKSFEDMGYLSNNHSYEHLYRDSINNGYNSNTYMDYIKFLNDMADKSSKNIIDLEKDNLDVYWHIKINESANNFLNEILNITCKINEISSFKINKFGKIFITSNIVDLERELLEFRENYNNSSVRNEIIDLRISEVIDNVREMVKKINLLISRFNVKINSMDFRFLYNGDRNLISRGYNCENDLLDENCYDLLASEARISSFLSIAKGDVGLDHWYSLNRLGIKCNKNKVLMSWYGSVSEYFMPMLYMKSYPKTLLYDTYIGYYNLQMKFAKHNKIPIGVSESCFYEFDSDFNYRYKMFGIPDVSIIKDYGNLVVSPYSSIVGSMVDFKSSIKNLRRLKKMGCVGKYGFYESIDFTGDRIGENKYCVIKNYVAIHEGMSLMALSNILMDDICQSRFENVIEVESIYELFNEDSGNILVNGEVNKDGIKFNINELHEEYIPRIIKYNKDQISEMQVYSNGEYSLGISSSGGGYLKFKDKYISKLSYDLINENTYGNIYIKDIDMGLFFSNTYLPCKNDEVNYISEFDLNKVIFKANSKEINIISEIFVSNDDNVEIRKIIFKNMTSKVKNLEITTYFESDILNKEFDFVYDSMSAICGNGNGNLFMGHSIYFSNNSVNGIKFENTKRGFLGLNGNLQYPLCMGVNSNYGNNKFKDDMIMSLRANIKLNPYEHISIYFINAIDICKENLCKLINKYKNVNMLSSIFYGNLYNFKMMVNNLKITMPELYLFNYMTSKIIYGSYGKNYILNTNINIKDLISHNIRYDAPIVALEVKNVEDLKNVEICIKALAYFTKLNLEFNLIILNSYLRFDKKIDNDIDRIIFKYNLRDRINIDNGIYILLSNIYKNTYDVIKNLANIFIESGSGDIYEQLGFNIGDLQNTENNKNNCVIVVEDNIFKKDKNIVNKYLFEIGSEISKYNDVNKYIMPKRMLKFYNSYGGYSKNYLEYVTKLNTFNVIPYIYRNILGNGSIFTCILSSGFMSTWAFKCKDFLITEDCTKNNYNIHGECIYIKEDDFVWSPTFNPIDNGNDYIVTNSTYSTKISNKFRDIKTVFECYIPDGKKYKIIKLEIKNLSSNLRNFSIYYFAPLILSSKDDYSKKLSIYVNREFNYIYGENNFSKEFKNIKSYLKIFGCSDVSFTGSKREFMGVNGSYFTPRGVYKDNLSNLTGIYLESCLCTSGKIKLNAFENKNIYFVLGYDDSIDEINLELNNLSNNIDSFNELYKLNKSRHLYKDKIFQIKTNDEHLDILFNQWSLYQNNNEKFFINNSCNGALDSCVNLMEKCLIYTYINSEESKKIIIKVFSNMYEDGSFKDKWSYLTKEYEINNNLYDLLWIIYIFIDYIKVTNDFDIFDIEINYLNSNDIKIKFSNIYEKCLRIIGKCISIDNLNNFVINKNILDVKTLFMLYMVLDEFDIILEKFEDYKNRDLFSKLKYDILYKLEDQCFNGEFFINSLNDINSDAFYRDIYLIPQIMALFSIKDHSICDKVIVSIEKYLINKELGFVKEFFDKDGCLSDEVRDIQNNREVILLIRALSQLKLNNKSYVFLDFLNPILMNKDRNSSNLYKYEPYIIPSKLEFSENNFLGIINEDFNHVSSLFYRVVLENILGFKLFENGFYIDPCVPDNWKQYTIEYIRDSVFYKIIIRRGDIKKVTINGEKHVEKFIKFKDNGEYIIDITI